MHVHTHGCRQADAQGVGLELGGLQQNAHRDALHDLDPVAGRILSRQQRKGAAAAGGNVGYVAVVFNIVPIEVGVDRHRLSGAHMLELSFLEVGVDPDIIERDYGPSRAYPRRRADPLARTAWRPGP